jgi:hypothetical protein
MVSINSSDVVIRLIILKVIILWSLLLISLLGIKMIMLLLLDFGTPYLQKLVEITCTSLLHEQFGTTSVAVIP